MAVKLRKHIDIRTVINQQPVLAAMGSAEKSMPRAYKFAERYIVNAIRNEVFTIFVQRLAARAGPGFPEIYTEHLMTAMQYLPIGIEGGQQVFAGKGDYIGNYGGISVAFSIDSLGDFTDFERGAHYKALLATGGEDNHPPSTGSRNHGKSGEHHGLNPHPARVELPYGGEPLMNQPEARKNFWESVVIDRDFGQEILLRRGKGNWTIGDHMERMGYEVSTENETYLARTLAWGNKAPQWLLLEYGSDRLFGNSRPKILPVNFYQSLQLITNCIGSSITRGVIESLNEQANAYGAQLNRAGQPFQVIPGRGASYTPYKEITEFKIADYKHCFGQI
jgi:hypothetical protein